MRVRGRERRWNINSKSKQELLKRTETIDPDFNNLNVALDKVSEVADHINNVIKERQNVEMLLSIQKKLTGTVPVRFFVFSFSVALTYSNV